MPKLSDSIKTKKINLSSIKGSELTIKTGVKAGDVEDIYNQGNVEMESALVALTKIIVDWNLENDDGEIAEINLKNIKKLNVKDVMTILKEANFVQEEDFMQAGKQKLEGLSEENEKVSEE